MKDRVKLNQDIKAPQVRLIDADGRQLGVVSSQEALEQAQQEGFDLVEISPQASPPVVKMVNWGKFKYEKTKQQQKARKQAKTYDVKQIRLGLKIGKHDLDVKLKQVRQFLEKGHKVKMSVFFRGREITHQELGYKLLNDVIESLSDVAVVDQEPQLTGKQLIMVIRKK